MNFPLWELEMGGGFLIALVAIPHVYVSHFAIGGGLFLVLTEHFAYRKNDSGIVDYLRTHSRFFALVTLVYGAITGVGIWFTIGLVSPAATSALIRTFVFGWATEWVFFFVEIAAAILYYRTWRTVSRKTHLAIGWIYFFAAFLSLVVINGILTFMLTPGGWTTTRSFWDGFFNPTYWPSAVARTAICIAAAGVYALLTGVWVRETATRARLVRYAGLWGVAGVVLAVPSLLWYRTSLPEGTEELLAGLIPTAEAALHLLPWAAAGLLLLFLWAVLSPARFRFEPALAAAVLGLVVFGALEWTREAIRKPYVIPGYMYSTGLLEGEAERMAAGSGLLASTAWAFHDGAPNAEAGEEVFRFACRHCHTLDGYRGVRASFTGLDAGYAAGLARRVDQMRGRMPAFPGTETEALALGAWIERETGPSRLPETDGAAFARRCGHCHSATGFRPLYDSMEGSSRDDIVDLVFGMGDLSDAMPAWTGTDREAGMIADHVLGWYDDGPGAGEGE